MEKASILSELEKVLEKRCLFIKKILLVGCLAGSLVEHATLDLRAVMLEPQVGRRDDLKSLKKKFC